MFAKLYLAGIITHCGPDVGGQTSYCLRFMRASHSDWQHLLKFEHCMRCATMNLDVFVQTAWAHLDIAGAAWDHNQKLATGFGASTLAEWAISQGQ